MRAAAENIQVATNPVDSETVDLLATLTEGIKDLKEFAPATAAALKSRWKEVRLPSLAKINTVDDAKTAAALFQAVIDEMPF